MYIYIFIYHIIIYYLLYNYILHIVYNKHCILYIMIKYINITLIYIYILYIIYIFAYVYLKNYSGREGRLAGLGGLHKM